MDSSAPASQVSRLIGDRLSQLSAEIEKLFVEASSKGRQEIADQLNQMVRRLRLCTDLEALQSTLVDAAGAFASGAAVFVIEEEKARGRGIRGVDAETTDAFLSVKVPLASAPALAGAVESRDPVTSVTSPAQISKLLMGYLRHQADGRVSIYPVVAGTSVPALVYAWGAVEGPQVELVTQVAAMVWIGIEAAEAQRKAAEARPLVQIAAPQAAKPDWNALSPDEQRVHFRAQRFARVQVAELRLHKGDAVGAGRAARNLYETLREPIESARKTFHDSFYPPCPSMVDYLHLELVRTLANDDPELLGKDYPGPLA
jgi:hypothetical protein